MQAEQQKKYFDIFCIAEFISCFLLFCVAMPLKYGYDILSLCSLLECFMELLLWVILFWQFWSERFTNGMMKNLCLSSCLHSFPLLPGWYTKRLKNLIRKILEYVI